MQVYFNVDSIIVNTWTSRNELIKLPVFEIKCKAMMGICIYWISRHVIFGKRCKTVQRSG